MLLVANYLIYLLQISDFVTTDTIEGFTYKFLQIFVIDCLIYLPLIMHSNAKLTLVESRALVSKIAIYSFSA